MEPISLSPSLVDRAFAVGSRLYERAFPGPARLGAPLQAAGHGDTPVVLVPGLGNDARFMAVWERSLQADGFRTFTFDDPARGLGDIRTAATRLASFAAGVQAATGSAYIDVVGYSAGASVARTWMQLDGGAPAVRRMISLDGTWNGEDHSRLLRAIESTPIAGASLLKSVPPALLDLQPSSALQQELLHQPRLPASVRLTSIYRSANATEGSVLGARNLPLRGSLGHLAVVRSSDNAYEAARAALLESQ
ncbi:MAG: hypothetical protein H7287_11965 [Thermoleophilia bacterium]|nr:hypothetical protein [Thermoleophilia bacterium]